MDRKFILFPVECSTVKLPATVGDRPAPGELFRRAVDAQEKLIAGIAGVTWLAIYKDRYEGARLWLESQNIQADAKGNYTVQLGAGKPDGLPLDLFSSGDVRSEHAHTENSRSPGMHLYI